MRLTATRLFAPLALSALAVPACNGGSTPGDSSGSATETDTESSTGTTTGVSGSTSSTSTTTSATDSDSTGGTSTSTGGSTGSTTGVGPTCTDNMLNGNESDVDCGGGTCDPCNADEDCFVNSDCKSNVCDLGICVAAACDDKVQNGGETDVDCGGLCPTKCIDTQGCLVNADCVSGFCDPMDNTCKPAACVNMMKGELETDVDCGGGDCPKCADTKDCLVDNDCVSGVCDANDLTCSAPACDDMTLNGSETDVDCGGPCPDCQNSKKCLVGTDCVSGVCQGNICVPGQCTDGVLNGGETDLDCGGACIGCDVGQTCVIPADCLSGVCEEVMANVWECMQPACDDMVQNGTETDKDCGGMCGATCLTGDKCMGGNDCVSGVCDSLADVCVSGNCSDQVQNGDETDKDCGGMCGATCGTNETCVDGGDCISGVCKEVMANVWECAAKTCMDGVQNGDETDEDCGGSCVNACDDNLGCEVNGDCKSLVCDPLTDTCSPASCNDGVQNQNEEGPDCNGSCDGACPLGNEIQVNTETTGFQLRPRVAAGPGGGYFVVVWTSVGQDGDQGGIYGQRYDAGGNAQGAEFLVNTTVAGNQDFAAIDAFDGGFVVTWTSPDSDLDGVVAQRFNNVGAKQGGEIQVNISQTDDQQRPDVAVANNGAFVVCFEGQGDNGSTYGTYCQQFNNSGAPVGGNTLVNTTTPGNQRFPAVDADSSGAYTVVWVADSDQDGDGQGIFMQRFTAAGAASGGETGVNTTTTGSQQAVQIGMNTAGAYTVVWNGPDASGDGAYAQRYNSSGVAQGSEIALNDYTSQAQINAAAAVTGDGNIVTVWQSDNQDGALAGIFGKRFLAAGTVVGGEFQVNTITPNNQDTPDVTILAADEFVVVWETGLTNPEIKMQRFNADFF